MKFNAGTLVREWANALVNYSITINNYSLYEFFDNLLIVLILILKKIFEFNRIFILIIHIFKFSITVSLQITII